MWSAVVLGLMVAVASPVSADLAAIQDEFTQRKADAMQALHQEQVARLAAYVGENPDAPDREAAYIAWLNTALEANLFPDARQAAVEYRAAYPDGDHVDRALTMQFLSVIYDDNLPADAALTEANALIAEWRADANRDPFEALRMRLSIGEFLIGRGRIAEARAELAKLAQEPLVAENPILIRQVKDYRQYAESIGRPFEDFSAQDMNGEDLSAAKYAGEVVLVEFWATWCAPCIDELPTLKTLYDKYNSKGFEIIGVSLDTNLQRFRAFVDEWDLDWTQYAHPTGPKNPIAAKYGVTRIPASILIDRNGNLYRRDLRGEHLEQAVATLVAQSADAAGD